MLTANGLSWRRSVRLKNADYCRGVWMVTMCAYDRRQAFGRIENDAMILNEVGRIIDEEWRRIPSVRPFVTLDEFQIMPNHLHGILDLGGGETFVDAPRQPVLRSGSLGAVVGGFKSKVTSRVRDLLGISTLEVWQRGFDERGIRSAKALEMRRRYIRENPMYWWRDPNNPDRKPIRQERD